MVIGIVLLVILVILVFIGWLIGRAFRARPIKAHSISYGLAIVAGVFTYAYLLTLDFPQLIKIVASIIVGIILIIFGALYQRRKARQKPR
ncbi:MAG: hypothetical protein ABR886_09370 [Dehalococcoidales bacterium]|jgi:hypothetical protein